MVLVKRPNPLALVVFLAVLWALAALGLLAYGVVLLATEPAPPAPVVHVQVASPPTPGPSFVLNNHPDNLPVVQRIPRWVQIDTPAGYGPVLRACLGVDGVYVGEQGGVFVVPHDPECLTLDPPAKSVRK
jgi:hypothetical protein